MTTTTVTTTADPSRNVFIIGLDDYNRAMLRTIRDADSLSFHGIVDPAKIYDTEEFDVPALLDEARAAMRAFDGPVDALAGYMDFPVSTMLPVLCREFGLPTVSLEALLKCEHKYWSRLIQKRVIADHIPPFAAFDPFTTETVADIPLALPFWVKPIKSSGSRLGFRVNRPEDFEAAIATLRDQIGLISEPFDHLLERADLPPEVRSVGGHYCLAEGIIGGRQCTQEGYVFNGATTVYGTVDSIRYPNGISFFRYQYPSKLPARVRRRMTSLSKKVMKAVGYDGAAFNIEYFWDEQADRIWLLEINTRVSQSHSDLFEKVDGATNQQASVHLALGEDPRLPVREGEWPLAAKFFLRHFEDGIVTRVPTPEEIARIEKKIPGTVILPQVAQGTRLSELPEQDSYSYALAHIFMGAKNQSTLLRHYERVVKALPFVVDPV